MKIILTFSFILFSLTIYSQKYTDCTYTYFKNGNTSTSKCLDENKQEGKSIAYNLSGEIIGEWKISRRNMLSGVHFSFHENGMVKKAEFSSHPDAGIQWYRSYTTYDSTGKKINFTEQSHDDDLTGPAKIKNVKTYDEYLKEQTDSLNKEKLKKTDTLKQETMQCAVIYVSELWIENKTGKSLIVNCDKKYKGDAKENFSISILIKKGEKVKITEQIQAQFYEDPMKMVNISIRNSKGMKKLNFKLSDTALLDVTRLNENRKGYVYEIK